MALAKSNGSSASRVDAVNILIQAKDQASNVFKAAATQLSVVGVAAQSVQQQLIALSATVTTVSTGLLGRVASLGQSVGLLRKNLSTAPAQSIFKSFQEDADQAISKTAKLTELLGSAGSTASPLLEGFFNISNDKIAEKSQALSDKIADTLVSKLKNTSGRWSEALINILPKQLGSKLQGRNVIEEALSGAANFGLDQYIKAKIPKELNNLTGGALTGLAKGLAVPKEIQQLLQGDFFTQLESVTSQALQKGFAKAYQNLDAMSLGSVPGFEKFGTVIAQNIAKGFKLSNVLGDLIQESLSKVDLRSIPKPFKEVAEGVLPQAIGLLQTQLQRLDEPFQAQIDKLIKRATGSGKKSLFRIIREQVSESISTLDQASGGLVSEVGGKLGTRLGLAFARGFASKTLTNFAETINSIDAMIRNTVEFIEEIPGRLKAPLDGVSNIVGIVAGAAEPLETFQVIKGTVEGTISKVFALTQQLAFFSAGMSALQQFVVGGPFETLIGQNVRLRESLLATQSSLVATNQVLDATGASIADPTAAIQSLEGPIKAAIARIRQGSLELVGVTSNQLIEAFQIVAGQASSIGISLQQASELTLSAAASLGTLGIPLAQARQELTSLIQGTIDMNSVLAKSLGITNQQVAAWKSQGTIFEQLTKRFEAFRAGNALSAMTLNGIASNIQELFDEIGRRAGEPLLEPLVKRLDEFYQYLNQNLDTLAQTATQLVQILFNAAQNAVDGVISFYDIVADLLGQLPRYLIESLANAISTFGDAIKNIIPIIAPAANTLAILAKQVSSLGGPFLFIVVQTKVLSTVIGAASKGFALLTQVLPGTGELLFLLQQRSGGLLNTFGTLAKSIGFGATSFLLLGKNLNKIPGAMGFVSDKLVGTLGPLTGFFTGLIPKIASGGITVVGLSKTISGLDKVLIGLAKNIPGLIGNFAGFVAQSKFAGGALRNLAPVIQEIAGQVSIYAKNIDNATFFNQKFIEAARLAGIEARKYLLSFSLLSAGVFAGFYIFDNFVLKNQGLIKVLSQIQPTLISVGKAIYNFLTNPLVDAIGFVVSLGVALQAGLIPKIIKVANTFLTTASEAIVTWSTNAREGLSKFSKSIRNTTFDVENLFNKRTIQQYTAEFEANLNAQTEAYERALAQRQELVNQLNQQLDTAANVDPNDPFAQPVDQNALKGRRDAIQEEMDEMINMRQAQQAQLVKLKEEVANAVPPATLAERYTNLSKTISTKTIVSMRQFQGVATKLSGDTLMSLGKKLGDLGFDELGQRIYGAGSEMFGFGNKVLTAQAAQKGFAGVVDASKVSLKDLRGAIGAAASGVKEFAGSVVTAAATLAETLGPIFLVIAAITVLTESIEAYTSITEASSKALNDYTTATMQSVQSLNELARERGEILKEDMNLESKRLAEIQKNQGPVTKFFEFLRNAANFLFKLNPFALISYGLKGLGSLCNSVGKYFQGLWQTIVKNVPFAAEVGEALAGLGEVIGKVFEPIAKFLKPVTDLFIAFKNGAQGVLDFLANVGYSSQAQAQLNNEIVGYGNLIKKVQGDVDNFQKTKQDAIKQEQELANLQRQRAEADAKGDKDEVSRLDSRIKRVKEEIQARKDSVDASIKAFEAQAPPSQTMAVAQAQLLKQMREYREELDKIADTQILPPDLPRLGTVYEQLSAKAQAAMEAVSKSTGTPEQFKQKADELLQLTDQQLKLGEITQQEARRRFSLIATNVNADQELQVKAQQAITQSYKDEGDNRVQEVETQLSQIEELTADGEVSEVESQRRITEIKAKELQIQLENLKAAKAEEDRIRNEEQEKALDAIDDQIAQSRNKLSSGELSVSDAEIERKNLTALLEQRSSLYEAFRTQQAQSDRQYANQSQQLETQIAQNEATARKQENDRILQDFDEAQAILEGRKSQGLVTEKQYADASLAITQGRLDEEFAQLEEQRQRLDKNDIEGMQAIDAKEAEIYKKRTAAAQQYYDQILAIADRARKKLQDAAEEAELKTQLLIQTALNNGDIQRDEADRRRLEASDARNKEELRLEEEKLAQLQALPRFDDPEAEEKHQQQIRDSRKRTEQLTLQIAETEYKRQEAARAAIQKKIKEALQEQENAGQAQTLILQEQERRLDAVGRILENQNKILEARKNYLEASAGLLDAQLNALQATASNENQRKEIAKLTALIQLRTLDQRQRIERELTQLAQEQQRLALEREKSENRIAQIRNRADVAKGLAEVARVDADPEASDAERQAARMGVAATLMEGQGLRQQESELNRSGILQERVFERENQTMLMRQQGDRLGAQVNLIQTLNPGDRRRAMREMQEQLLGQLGFGSFSNLRQSTNQATDQMLARMFPGEFGGRAQPGSNLPRGLTPQSPGIEMPGAPKTDQRSPLDDLSAIAGDNPPLQQSVDEIVQLLGELGATGLDQSNNGQPKPGNTPQQGQQRQQRQQQRSTLTNQAPAIPNLRQQNQGAAPIGASGELNAIKALLLNIRSQAGVIAQNTRIRPTGGSTQIINQFKGDDVLSGNFRRTIDQQILDSQYSLVERLKQR